MIGWKFRINWLGRAILQRFKRWEVDGHEYGRWVDANSQDLVDYYCELSSKF